MMYAASQQRQTQETASMHYSINVAGMLDVRQTLR